MPQTTPKLGMTTYDLVNDGSVYFSTFRTTLAGYTNSALTKIDDFATQISADVNLLKSNPPIVRISAIKTDDFSYAVTGITEVTAYNNGMYINLSLDNTNIGTVSLNINNLGAKGVYKVGADGLVANMSAGDLRKNKMQLFRYNGTAWVWVNAITSDQLNIVGTAGNLTKISSDNTLEDSGVTFATTATNNTLVQRTSTGQIKGVTPSTNDDLANKQYVDTKAPLISPTLTGTPIAPTATAGTNTTQIATTAFVNSEISNDRPYATTTTSLINGGTGIAGTSSSVARADHTHTIPKSVLQSQVINDLITGGETNVLSAQQGKVLSSAIGQIGSDLNAHKAESVSFHAFVTRNITLLGEQKIALPFLAKSIEITCGIENTNSLSIGKCDYSKGQSCIIIAQNGYVSQSSLHVITIFDGTVNALRGAITKIENDGITINWFYAPGSGLTGILNMSIIAHTH